MRSSIVAFGLLGPWLCAGPVVLAAEESSPPVEEEALSEAATAEEEALGEAAPAEDLDAIQGLWVRTERVGLFGSKRTTKEVEGDAETVTYYDSKGNVERAHKVKITLRRVGPIKVFVFHDHEVTAGPDKGEKMEGSRAYIYKVVGDTFVEIWGVLGDEDQEIRVLRWKRQKAAD